MRKKVIVLVSLLFVLVDMYNTSVNFYRKIKS